MLSTGNIGSCRVYPKCSVHSGCVCCDSNVCDRSLAAEEGEKELSVAAVVPVLMYCLYCAMYAPGIYAGVEV